MVVFSSASAALDCGVAMQQAVELGNRGLDHAIQLRVGLSGGEVAHEEDDYFGDPVIEAARLCAACDPGQTLASEVVPMMAGRRSRLLDVRPLGGLQLKGFGYPVPYRGESCGRPSRPLSRLSRFPADSAPEI